MVNYGDVISVGGSLLLIIVLGYLTCKFKIIPFSSVAPINKFLLNTCYLPLIAKQVSVRKIYEISFMPLALGSCTTFTMQLLLAIIFFLPFKDRFYIYISTFLPCFYINLLIVGIPIFNAIWDEKENVMISVLALSNDLITCSSYLIISKFYVIYRANKQHNEANDGIIEKFDWRIIFGVLKRLITNPIVIGNVLGFIYAATGWKMCPYLMDLMTPLSDVVLALSLFTVGGFLSQHSLIACSWLQFIFGIILRHLIYPLVMGFYCWVFGISGKLSRQCILMSCLPSATASYLLSDQINAGQGMATTMIFWTTILCVPFQILWYYCLNKFNVFPE